MAILKLKHVESWKDRYGNRRFYFRIGKGARVALKGEPGTTEFSASYAVASGKIKASGGPQDGTFNAIAKAYFTSVKFKKTKPVTQRVTRQVIETFCEDHGHRIVRQMKRQHVEAIVSSKAETPAAANVLLKKIRLLVKLAIAMEQASHDPTQGVEMFKYGTFHTWTEKEILQYESKWPLGCRERIAFDLHLYTGQRRGDVCKLSEDNFLPGDLIEMTQDKTGKHLIIPIHPNLARSLNLWTGKGKAIIAKDDGEPYTVDGYGHFMSDAIRAAGLPVRCVLHGLRKAAARRLAEAGCTAHQIQSITGHVTLEEVERYTKAANQRLLAGQAISSLGLFRKA